MEDKINLLIWAIGGGFAGTWAMLFYILNRIGKLDEKINDVEKRLTERLNEIDKRLVAVETTLRIQGACALKEGKVLEKAE